MGSIILTELLVPARLRVLPAAVPEGPLQNVGQAYVRMAKAIFLFKSQRQVQIFCSGSKENKLSVLSLRTDILCEFQKFD